MKTNRKKSDTYRFNGDPSQDPNSIRPVTIADLEARIEKYTAKHADPSDPDDKKWIQAWIRRYESELKKKRRPWSKNISLKPNATAKSENQASIPTKITLEPISSLVLITFDTFSPSGLGSNDELRAIHHRSNPTNEAANRASAECASPLPMSLNTWHLA